MYVLFCRLYQFVLRVFAVFLPWRKPYLLEGANSLEKLPALIKKEQIDRVLLITDKGIISLGLIDALLEGLKKESIAFVVFDKTVPNPTIDNIEEAVHVYRENKCMGIIAFGGGSPIDCAKGVGARVARPNKTISQMRGLLHVLKKLPPIYAVPTTSGTGSEGTIAAVITDSKTREKYALNDVSLIPHCAVLDPLLTVGLPPHITSTTGMDALTHAIEAYIGGSNTKETWELARKATVLVFENILKVYANGADILAREKMQIASYYGGLAFTRAYVGNIHAIAHTLGGFYGVPHGLANAVILPYMLDFYGASIYRQLSELADVVEISDSTDSTEQKAKKFIAAIRTFNRSMNIPEKIAGIKNADIPLMVERALHEANPLYPVPVIMTKKEMSDMYALISAGQDAS